MQQEDGLCRLNLLRAANLDDKPRLYLRQTRSLVRRLRGVVYGHDGVRPSGYALTLHAEEAAGPEHHGPGGVPVDRVRQTAADALPCPRRQPQRAEG